MILTSKINVRLPEDHGPEPHLQVFHPGFPARLVMLGHAARTFWTYPYTLKRHLFTKISKIGFATIWQNLQRFAILSELSVPPSSSAPIPVTHTQTQDGGAKGGGGSETDP